MFRTLSTPTGAHKMVDGRFPKLTDILDKDTMAVVNRGLRPMVKLRLYDPHAPRITEDVMIRVLEVRTNLRAGGAGTVDEILGVTREKRHHKMVPVRVSFYNEYRVATVLPVRKSIFTF